MNKQCTCEACLLAKHHSSLHKNELNKDNLSEFKDNIQKIASLSDYLDVAGKNEKDSPSKSTSLMKLPSDDQIFRLLLVSVDPTNELSMECSKSITEFEFISLMEEFFDIVPAGEEEDYDDYPSAEGIRYFDSYEEVIDYLESRNKDDE